METSQSISVAWFEVSQNPTGYVNTFAGQARVGGSPSFSIDITVNLPQVDYLGQLLLFIEPVGNFFNYPAFDAFVTRVKSIDPASNSAVIHITRADVQTGWSMDLSLSLLLVNHYTA